MTFNKAYYSGRPFKRKYDAKDAWLIKADTSYTADASTNNLVVYYYSPKKGPGLIKVLARKDLESDDWVIL